MARVSLRPHSWERARLAAPHRVDPLKPAAPAQTLLRNKFGNFMPQTPYYLPLIAKTYRQA